MLHSFYTSAPITVVDMVFLGDQRHAVNQDLIESMKFAGIVNGISLLLYNMLILSNLYWLILSCIHLNHIAVTWDIPSYYDDLVEYLKIPVEDKSTTNLMQYFDASAAFIGKSLLLLLLRDLFSYSSSSLLLHC